MDLGTKIGIASIPLAFLLWWVQPKHIVDFFKNKSLVDYIIKKKTRQNYKLAIVDDEINSYPVDYIKKLGINVTEFDSISFAETDNLCKFDVILLDVKGVVKEDLEEGGAKLIKILKQSRPYLPIIAVSSGYFHPELNDYFKSSDATLNKPIDEYKIRELLLDLKKEFFDANEIAFNIEQQIKKLDINNTRKNKITRYIINYLSDSIDEYELFGFIHQLAKTESPEIIRKIKILKDRIEND